MNRSICRYIVLGVLFASCATLSLLAQAVPRRGPEGPPNPERELAMLTRWLDLTEDQVALIKPIVEENHLRRQAVFENAAGDREAVRTQMEDLREETFEQFSEILTDEQMTEYKKMTERFGRRPGDRGRGPRPF